MKPTDMSVEDYLKNAIRTVVQGEYYQEIGEYMFEDKRYNKNNVCIHGLPLYNGCEECLCEYLNKVLDNSKDTCHNNV